MLPKIRFDEISGKWEIIAIDSLISLNCGKDYKHLKSGQIPVIGTSGPFQLTSKKINSIDETIFIGRKGTIDKPFKYSGDFWAVDTVFYITNFNKNNIDFIFSLFKRINWNMYNEASGVPSLSKQNIINRYVYTTSINEQIKIGNYLKEIDNLKELYDC